MAEEKITADASSQAAAGNDKEASGSGKPAKGAKKQAQFGLHSAFGRVVRWQRLIIQIIFLVLAPQTFSLAFAGVKQLFVSIGKGDVFDANTFLFLMLILVVFTIVFGRFFCGYICAFGTVGDLLYKVVNFPFSKLHVKRPKLPVKAVNVLRYLKYVVLVFFLVASVIGVGSVVNVYSPWTAFGRLLALNIDELNVVGLALLVLIAIGMILEERFFCKFLCPMGAVFSLLPQLPLSSFRRQQPPCDECGACQRNCPADIYPPGSNAQMGECFSCGRCASVCHKQCIGQCSAKTLAARLEAGTGLSGSPVKKSQTPKVVVLAVVLLVVFWLLGAVNYLPASPLG